MSTGIALDTNAYRALDDGNTTLRGALRQTASIGLPMTVLGEIYYGLFYGTRTAAGLQELHRFLANPRLETLQITTETAKLYGEISTELRRAGAPIQQNDVWIAALCKQYGYVLATADHGFENVLGLELLTF